MPIRTTIVDLREQIAIMALSERYTITEIADLFGVTRPTVYRYRDRYRSDSVSLEKIRRRMLDDDADLAWPARSTIDEILRREGLARCRPRRRRYRSPFRQRFEAIAPGQLQTIDFKGEFRLRDGRCVIH